jgi:hypothetical protein
MPIVMVEYHIIGDGRVGPMAKRIFELFEGEMEKLCGKRPAK